ncbi:hypothetical protein [Paenibacillus ginsengarvi]|uniref:GNAT family N-acetyltransferase n=1 Tax=Paenibacillus ginsengarvi TaxID=400777 RepID=A0A3B0BKD8_9BACL|nr:hypothetical protein [Paenibacillus ginsengarvi]RKN72970.1 hypothetical protein D7M11_27870 [Paenibacillus ginsengarvi]
MKIAFDTTLPDRAKVAALIRESGLEGGWDAGRFFEEESGDCRVISAYDVDRLVGVGRMLDSDAPEDGMQGRLDIVVLPDYRSRDIVGTIFKLLRSQRKAGAGQAAAK